MIFNIYIIADKEKQYYNMCLLLHQLIKLSSDTLYSLPILLRAKSSFCFIIFLAVGKEHLRTFATSFDDKRFNILFESSNICSPPFGEII